MEPARSVYQGFDTVQQFAELPASTIHVGKDRTEADQDEEQSHKEKQHRCSSKTRLEESAFLTPLPRR
jgi:hypothetical protein